MYESLLRSPEDLFAEFDRLQRGMEQLFGTAGAPSSIRPLSRGAFPAVNVGTTVDTIEVIALAPGVDAQALDVSIDKGLLTIAGERKSEVGESNQTTTVYARERHAGPFKRVISLPEDADPTRVDASYQDGVLHITVQKRESSKPRRVEIS